MYPRGSVFAPGICLRAHGGLRPNCRVPRKRLSPGNVSPDNVGKEMKRRGGESQRRRACRAFPKEAIVGTEQFRVIAGKSRRHNADVVHLGTVSLGRMSLGRTCV